MKNLYLITLMLLFVFACDEKQSKHVQIGNYYPDVLHGITFKYDNNQAFLFRIGYLDSANHYIHTYNQHLKTISNQSGQKFKGSAPDYSYNQYGFSTGDNIIWIEWSLLETGNTVVGKIYAEQPQELFLEAMQAWPDELPVSYQVTENGFAGRLSSETRNQPDEWFWTALNQKPLASYTADSLQALLGKITKNQATTSNQHFVPSAALKYQVSAGQPLYFISGQENADFSREQIDAHLKQKSDEYQQQRFAIHTPFGEIWEPVANHLNSSRVYGTQTKTTAHVVSRGWCNEHNQRIFEWDTFFHALLASLEDPEGGKESVRSILAHQTPEGIVPNNNYGNDTINNSNDRSQPPVGAICVWKMHQYHPDTAFLADVYPKLLKWHNWWFDTRPENGLPYRDGNQNGLLEWGTEIDTWLQGAKYESGQDNSPMFDNVRMNETSRTMELDMAGLSGLWAADALCLSYIADAIGKPDDANMLMNQVEEINNRINQELWNEQTGMYCNKYWDAYSRKPDLDAFKILPREVFADPIDFYYQDAVGNNVKKQVEQVGLNTTEIKALGLVDKDYSPYSREENPIEWRFTLKPVQTGVFFFYTPEDFGVHLEVNGQTIIDNRKFWITEYISNPVSLQAGKLYECKLKYTGDIAFTLQWAKEQKSEKSLFSERLGPTNFYPLIAKAADENKGQQIIANLTDTTLFWGDYVLPTIARDDPAFPSQGYWRGRIWPPTNYLAYLGINNYASDEITWQYAVKGARQAQDEWIRRGHLYENYYADGPGAGDPHYCWGGLMQMILLEELAGIDENGNLVTNPFSTDDYEVSNFPVAKKSDELLSTR